ncbi:hypothetical protein FQA39_LY16510 [Lamprigera yunnana]|nr:hypothetical protein FQA39_LY16510 [Lamprigera yunnana]
MGWKKASKYFSVPKTTLMRLFNMKYGSSKNKKGRPTVLGKDPEEQLVQYYVAMEASFVGLTKNSGLIEATVDTVTDIMEQLICGIAFRELMTITVILHPMDQGCINAYVLAPSN